MASNADHDALTSEFMAMTGASTEQATQYLSGSNWDLPIAAQAFFADEEEEDGTSAPLEDAGATSSSSYTGPRTLDGRPAPQAIPTTSSSSKRPPKKKGLATLSSIGGGHGHDHAHDNDDDDGDDDARRDTYAGGEKSGLAVQDPSQRSTDPRRIINDLLAKAQSDAQRPEASTAGGPSASNAFRGSGQTLGGEGTPSRTIPDPHAQAAPSARARPQGGEVQERTLHLWRDGFSIDDGELRRFDDPQNSDALRMIQQGRAPIHLMNVRYHEPLDVKLQQHDENYRPLPKVYKPFGGEGRRLGSPVPGDSATAAGTTTSVTAGAPSSASTAAAAAAPSSSAGPSTLADESQPTLMIRIQMPDGTRLPARFNTSQTVNDVYDFISRSSPDLRAGGWVLATTFPNKDHTDKSLTLGDMPEFKKGGTAMVKRNK